MIALDDVIAATHGQVLVAGARVTFPGFAHDSRQVAPGACFVAVRGPHQDGHDFVEEAIRRGAGAALVESGQVAALEDAAPGWLARLEEAGATVVAVADTRMALRSYAAHVLAAWHPVVIAVAGSTGKTTTKEAIADVLGCLKPTFRSWRNYNDLLGLPLSLGGLEPDHAFAVLEMGCDRPGEIAALCAIAHPTVGVVTNVSATHLQDFGTVGRLARELSDLPRALPEDGMAVLPANDPAVRAMGTQTHAAVHLFCPLAADDDRGHATDASADGSPDDSTSSPLMLGYTLLPIAAGVREALTLRAVDMADATRATDTTDTTFAHLHGDHWAGAILAALTVGAALGVAPEQGIAALRALRPLPGRLNLLDGRDGLALFDDTHNASPASVRAGLVALGALGARQRRIAVLGDMLRLGTSEMEAHREAGREAAARATHLVTLGTRAETIASAARRAGMPRDHIAVTRTHEDAAAAALAFAWADPIPQSPPRRGEGALKAKRRESAREGDSSAALPVGKRLEGDTLALIKGSEEMRMERVTELLLAHPEQANDLLDRQTPAWQRMVVMRPDRPTWLEVDLGAIGRNTQLLKELVGPRVRVLASLKADAYGHGALAVARVVLRHGASWLGVATVSEARPLREAGITAPILVFGFIPPWQAREAVRLDLRATVYSLDLAQALAGAARDLGRVLPVHVKIDSGMGRLGVRAEDVDGIVALLADLSALPGLEVEGIYTHLATADSADQTYARRQIARFERVLAALDERGLRPPIVHAANSAATLTLPEIRYDLVRPGIALYGLAPSAEVPLPPGFKPALAFKTQVAQVKDVPAGEGISYGATYITTGPTRVATLPVGYADGFRRAPANWGDVLVRGQHAPLIGTVCMDQCMIDVSQIAGVRVGDEVVLLGRQGGAELTAEEVAVRLGTIHYEVIAELLARVPRVS